ncbi:hypothetical protein PsorP6_003016 [Peronosclerospora sorghi]|uniref:Uncharacterized protein n=1 Tax=Peronosclerospora sorghi TaxID=230839 RepID=A0ACC0VRX9_9STRA|nr:hypothetical protein PsorP6_003016 [Peronosclerospora sorghi]
MRCQVEHGSNATFGPVPRHTDDERGRDTCWVDLWQMLKTYGHVMDSMDALVADMRHNVVAGNEMTREKTAIVTQLRGRAGIRHLVHVLESSDGTDPAVEEGRKKVQVKLAACQSLVEQVSHERKQWKETARTTQDTTDHVDKEQPCRQQKDEERPCPEAAGANVTTDSGQAPLAQDPAVHMCKKKAVSTLVAVPSEDDEPVPGTNPVVCSHGPARASPNERDDSCQSSQEPVRSVRPRATSASTNDHPARDDPLRRIQSTPHVPGHVPTSDSASRSSRVTTASCPPDETNGVVSFHIVFHERGSLGFHFEAKVDDTGATVTSSVPDVAAATHSVVQPDDELVAVNEHAVDTAPFPHVMLLLQGGLQPLTLTFRRRVHHVPEPLVASMPRDDRVAWVEDGAEPVEQDVGTVIDLEALRVPRDEATASRREETADDKSVADILITSLFSLFWKPP